MESTNKSEKRNIFNGFVMRPFWADPEYGGLYQILVLRGSHSFLILNTRKNSSSQRQF